MKYNLKSDTFCGQIPSLKYQAIPNISIQLWRGKLQRAVIARLLNMKNIFIIMDLFEKEMLKEISRFIPSNCKEDLELINGLIKEQIMLFLISHDHFFHFTSLDKFNIYFDSICWTPHGTINMINTANKIIEKTSLSIKEKYILACANCLEEKVRDLLKLLPKDFSGDIKDSRKALVELWTRYVKEGRKSFSIDEKWELILYTSICCTLDVAVEYFLKNYLLYLYANYEQECFAGEYYELKDASMKILISAIGKRPNIYLYFLQNIPGVLKYRTNLETNKKLLIKLHYLSKWSTIILAWEYVHELIKFSGICDAFEIIIFCWHKNIVTLKQYTILWNELTSDFKIGYEENFGKIFEAIYKSCLGLTKKDFVTIKFLMSKSTPENLKKILYLEEGIFFCEKVIISEGPNFLDNLIYQALKAEKEISEFKINYFNDQGLFIIAELIAYCKFESINEFISKFCAEDERIKFKYDLPYIENSIIIQYISHEAKDNKRDFLTALNNFLHWHFEGNEEEICTYTSTVFDLETDSYRDQRERFFEVIQDLIEEEKWEFVERYWKWIYSATREEIDFTKAKLMRMIKILLLSSKGQCISPSMRYFSRNKLFKRLVTSCFKPDELEDIRKLRVRNYFQLLVIELLEKDRHQEVNDLIDWFLSSDETKVDEFKISFMLSHLGLMFLYNSIKNDPNLKKVIFLFKKWLNCSIDQAKLFQHRFVNFVKEKAESKQQNLDQNNNGGNKALKTRSQLNNNVQKCVDFLKVLLREKISLDKTRKEIVYSEANRNSKKRVSDHILFQNRKRRKN